MNPENIISVSVNWRRLFQKLPVLLLLLGAIFVGLTAESSCMGTGGGGGDQTTQAQQNGQSQNADAYTRLSKAEPAPQLNDSLARKEINQRYALFNDTTRFGYFYAFLPGVSQPVSEYIVKGGVFPVDDMVSPTQSVTSCADYAGSNYACGAVVSAPQPDGTFGTNGNGLFGFEADGAYFEWSGIYYYGTEPMPGLHPAVVMGCVTGAKC